MRLQPRAVKGKPLIGEVHRRLTIGDQPTPMIPDKGRTRDDARRGGGKARERPAHDGDLPILGRPGGAHRPKGKAKQARVSGGADAAIGGEAQQTMPPV